MALNSTELPAPVLPDEEKSALNFWSILGIIRQRIHIALTVFAVVTVLTVAYAWTRVPKYTATARLLVETRGINLTDMSDAFDPARGNMAQRDVMQTQVQLLTSAPVLKKVLQQGIFADSPSISNASDPVAALARLVKVTPAPSGYILDVSVTHPDPVKAQRTVNAVIDAYQEENRARRSNVSEEGIEQLKAKRDNLLERLNEEEAAIRTFMEEQHMSSFETEKALVEERQQSTSRSLSAAEPRRIQAETQYRTAQDALDKDLPLEVIPGFMESSIASSLKIELAKRQREENDLELTYGANNPKLQAPRAQIAMLEAQLRAEAERLVQGLHGRYLQILGEEEMLRAELEAQTEEVARIADLGLRYQVLRQTRDSVQENYNSVVHRIEELDTSNLSSQGDSVFLVAPADVPNIPSWPNKPKMLALGIFFGLLLGVGLCFLLDYLDTTIKDESDIQTYVRRPLLGSVPAGSKGADGEHGDDFQALKHPHSTFAEAFRTIRTCLSFSVTDHPIHSLVVSSSGPAEGKSLCALNLAIAFAQTNRRTLVIDADMRKPRLSKTIPDALAIGLSDLLAGDSEFNFKDLVTSTQVPMLSFLSAGTIPPNPVSLLESPRFAKLLADLKAAYDLVLFDTPPCLNMVDAMVVAKQTDGLVFISRSYGSNKFATQQAIRQLETSNVPVLGAILNDVNIQKSHYYYYYSSKYYHRDEERDNA